MLILPDESDKLIKNKDILKYKKNYIEEKNKRKWNNE